jgi:hemolysin activation/secretion protein
LIYSDEVQRLVFGAFPYSTLATAFSQKVLSSDNDHSHAVKLVLDVRRQWPVATLHEIAGRFLAGQSFGGFDEERRFTLGGNGRMRGYSPTSLSGESIVLASLEYRWPVLREIDDNLGGLTVLRRLQAAIFADVGTVSSYRRYRTDVGFGVRITHDVLGLYPVVARFDVALPINVEAALKADEQSPHYYFTAGQPF